MFIAYLLLLRIKSNNININPRQSRRKQQLSPEYVGISIQNRQKIGIPYRESQDSTVTTSQKPQVPAERHKISHNNILMIKKAYKVFSSAVTNVMNSFIEEMQELLSKQNSLQRDYGKDLEWLSTWEHIQTFYIIIITLLLLLQFTIYICKLYKL